MKGTKTFVHLQYFTSFKYFITRKKILLFFLLSWFLLQLVYCIKFIPIALKSNLYSTSKRLNSYFIKLLSRNKIVLLFLSYWNILYIKISVIFNFYYIYLKIYLNIYIYNYFLPYLHHSFNRDLTALELAFIYYRTSSPRSQNLVGMHNSTYPDLFPVIHHDSFGHPLIIIPGSFSVSTIKLDVDMICNIENARTKNNCHGPTCIEEIKEVKAKQSDRFLKVNV